MTVFSLPEIVQALDRNGLNPSVTGTLPPIATSITDDSRRVFPGSLFVAISGTARDGHEFIGQAEEAGACALVCEHPVQSDLPRILVRNGRVAAAIAAAIAYGNPGRALELVGITGTNGKTTTAGILRHLLDEPSARSASIGTVGILIGSAGAPLAGGDGLTTPGPVELQRVLSELVTSGVRTVAMEVSSHSLNQDRVEGLEFTVALFTNLTRDHLDYHGTMERYAAAKFRLLDYLKPKGLAIVNADDPAWDSLTSAHRQIRFGIRCKADLMARKIEVSSQGSEWELCAGSDCHSVNLPMIGDFNVANALGAAAAAWALGRSLESIASSLGSSAQVPGRLEIIARNPIIVRDYAHTPDALEHALRALRPITTGRLICVFGCGGDRDKGKRPLMGQAAEGLSDIQIVTSDNPRTEPPESIIDDIVAGMISANHERVTDRHDAIARAIALAGPADLILLAGKGHETYQIRGAEKYPFDEMSIVRELTGATA